MGKTLLVLLILWTGGQIVPLDNRCTGTYVSPEGTIKIGTSIGSSLVVDADGKVEYPLNQTNPKTNNLDKEKKYGQ